MPHRPIPCHIWETIQDEGLDQEQNALSRNQWEYVELPINPNDRMKLKNFDPDTVDKFNEFDIELKNYYRGNYIDLINYSRGKVYVVRKRRPLTHKL